MIAESKLIVRDAGPFKILYDLPKDINTVICIGGRGGRKSYEVSKFCIKASCIDQKRICIMRDEKVTIRESILNEIFVRYDTANQHGHFDGLYDKIETGIRDLSDGNMIVFTKGFRASSKEKKANIKGISDVDIAIIEEAEDIRDVTRFNTLRDSMRKKGRLIIIMLNTPDVNHWIINMYFDLVPILDHEGRATGYFKLEPKKIRGFLAIITSYKDNPYLSEDVIRDYEGYGDPQSHLYDLHHYYTSILGYASSGRKGQVLTKVKKISLQDYLQLPYREIYGLDFGTSSPAGLIGVKIHHNTAWARQLNYLPKDTLPIGKMLCDLRFTSKEIIIADSASPGDINRLRNGWSQKELDPEDLKRYPQLTKGFTIYAVHKGPGSIESGLRLMRSMELYAVEESKDLWNEIQNYIYAVDKNNQPLDEPVDDFNHLIDPWRYVIWSRGRLF